jgi:hypothetical protein
VAQELYDGQGKKIITYPRAEVRYLPQSLISGVPRIVAGLRVSQSFSAIPVPEPPVKPRTPAAAFNPPNVASTDTLPAPGQANRSKDGPILTRDCDPDLWNWSDPIEAKVRHQAWEFIEQIIRGEHDAAWYGRESPRATAHARISRRRISRRPVRGPSWQAQSA